MNKIIIKGRLAKEPMYLTTASKGVNIEYARFDLISDKTHCKKDNNGDMPTNYFNCTLFNEHNVKYLKNWHTGDELVIMGSINSSTPEDKANDRIFWNVVVTEIVSASQSLKNQEQQPRFAQTNNTYQNNQQQYKNQQQGNSNQQSRYQQNQYKNNSIQQQQYQSNQQQFNPNPQQFNSNANYYQPDDFVEGELDEELPFS